MVIVRLFPSPRVKLHKYVVHRSLVSGVLGMNILFLNEFSCCSGSQYLADSWAEMSPPG